MTNTQPNYGIDLEHPDCKSCKRITDEGGFGPTHDGSRLCESGSIASGGATAHCTCDWCF